MKKLIPWLIAGLILRLVLSATTLHPDVRGHNLAGYLIAQKGHLFDFYDYLSRQPRTDHWVVLYHDDLFIYPPLAYIAHAVSNFILYPLYPKDTFLTLITDMGQAQRLSNLWQLIVLLKLPYLVADILCLLVLRKLVEEKYRFLASLVWIFNPLTIYAAYMVGQFDIFIALFILLALKNSKFAPVLLGLAAGFKPFPLFLIPFLPGNKIKNIALGLFTYVLLILPYFSSPGFRSYALAAPQTDKLRSEEHT